MLEKHATANIENVTTCGPENSVPEMKGTLVMPERTLETASPAIAPMHTRLLFSVNCIRARQ